MQYNIFQNDFYDSMPGIPWAYRIDVLIGDPPREVAKLAKAVKEVDIPEAELQTYEVFHAGLTFKIPTRYKNSSYFGVTFNDDKNLSIYRELMNLFRRSYDNREQTVKSAINSRIPNFDGTTRESFAARRKYANSKEELIFIVYLIDPRKTVQRDTQLNIGQNAAGEEMILGLTTNDPEIVAAYTFRDCFIENLDNIDLDYSSEDCIEWSIRLHFNEMSVEYPHQERIVVPEESETFRMEDLAIPDRVNIEDKKYRAKLDKTIETENTGKYAEISYHKARSYLEEQQKLIEKKQEAERTKALETFDETANEAGMDVHGNYGRFSQKEDAMTEESDEAVLNTLDEYAYGAMKEEGIELLQDDETNISRQAVEAENRMASNQHTGYGIGDWQIAPNAVQASRNLKSELKKIPTEVDIAFRDAGVVELPQSDETAQYYGENRNTLAKNTYDQGVIGALTTQSKTELEEAEAERQYWRDWYVKERTLYQKGQRTHDQWIENVDFYLSKLKESEARVKAAKSSYDKIKSENPSVAREIDRNK